MIKLLIIADDFTGALDTSVQFVKYGAKSKVLTDRDFDFADIEDEIDVLVVDSETRHLSAELAYRIVSNIVKRGMEQEIPYIYKKTDSALRGNIGAELAALANMSGAEVHFIPAFPKMNRITENGIHYIDGIPLGKSIFSTDPFEPILYSSIPELLRTQTSLPIQLKSRDAVQKEDQREGSGLAVYDATSDLDMERIANKLAKEGKLQFCAGCAGFAEKLAERLEFSKSHELPHIPSHKLAVFCGSVNEVSIRQLDFAEAKNYARLHLNVKMRMEKGWADTAEGKLCISKWEKILSEKGLLLIDANDEEKNEVLAENRELISKNLGDIIRCFLNLCEDAVLFLTGGDTLLGAMNSLSVGSLRPLRELLPGVVMASFRYHGNERICISKSGGFGEEDLILQVLEILKELELC